MRCPPLSLLAASLLLATGIASAASPTSIPAAAVKTAEQLRDRAMHDDTGYRIVASLTTEVGPRMAGSEADQRARDWAIAKFKALGYDKVYTEAVTFPLWQRRSEHGAIVAPFPQPLVLTALGYSPGTAKGGLTAQVLKFDSLDALKAADPASVKGRIVYIGYRMQRHKDGHDYGMGSAVRTAGPVIAAAKGAAGYLLRSAGTDANQRIAHTGVTGFTDPAKAIPAAALSNPDADQLERVLAYGKPVTVKLDLDCGIVGEYTGANVIGEITGKKYPDQVVAIGGHLDSWDLAEGAHDDGTGVTGSVEALRILKALGYKPKNTIRAVFFMNEENGDKGGLKYAELAATNKEDHIAAIESDLGGFTPRGFGFTGLSASQFKNLGPWKALFEPYGSSRFLVGGGGSDIGPLKEKTPGVVLIGFDPDSQRYFDVHHTPNDVFENVNKRELELGAASMASLIYLIDQHGFN